MHEFHIVCPNSILFNYSKNVICEACLSKKIKYPIFFMGCDRRGKIFSFLKGLRSLIANNILGHVSIIDKFICPSNFIKDKLIEGNIAAEKIVIVRNPIVLSEKYICNSKENVICFFGRFSKEKNLIFLIKSFDLWKQENNNNFRLLLIGEGDDEKEMKQVVSNCLSKPDIIFKPFMTFQQLQTEIQKVKYYAMTSIWYENAPMGILESIALNIIPIVPNIGGMKEIIEKVIKVGGVYESQNLKSWCNTMNYLEKNYEDLLIKLRLVKKDLIKNYSEEFYLKIIQNLYKEAMK